MSYGALRDYDSLIPEPQDSALARKASEEIAAFLLEDNIEMLQLIMKKNGKEIMFTLPNSALCFFLKVLTQMADGNAVTLVPIHAELSTQVAADLLNVSRPFFVRLLEKRELPFHKVGRHRRVKFYDLLEFKRKFEANSLKAREKLTEQGQELDLGY